MSNPQKITFKTIQDFLDRLPEDELQLVHCLRELILDSIPDCRERLAYNIPFYYWHARICYIWPASVPWGAVDQGVAIGFCRGHLLSTVTMPGTGQIVKQVFTSIREVDANALRQLLYEAVQIDKDVAKANG